MGNSQNKNINNRSQELRKHNNDNQAYTSQFSLSQFIGNLSGRSFLSVTSNQSVYSASRPWSRVSRRRWNESTLKNPLEASKTAWPVARIESSFLPEFPIVTDLLQKDFKILNTIAKGAFGEVYKVRKLSTNKLYALKVLQKSQIISENAVRQVKEEARIQEACGHHSFIVGAVSKWQTKKRLYIVSEYVAGGELLDLLEAYGKLPKELVQCFVAEIAVAIDFLHNAGVIYRDLKPENILLDSNLHIQLIDFGLSKWLSIGARTTTLCGTLKYMAPEILSREPYGHAVDWWSLGVVAYRMLTAEYPPPAAVIKASSNCATASGSKSVARDARDTISELCDSSSGSCNQQAGVLPKGAMELSYAARGLLVRLLERDPQKRLRSVRQLQQTAFYMGYKFDDIRNLKIIPRIILESYFPDGPPQVPATDENVANAAAFTSFDQATIV